MRPGASLCGSAYHKRKFFVCVAAAGAAARLRRCAGGSAWCWAAQAAPLIWGQLGLQCRSVLGATACAGGVCGCGSCSRSRSYGLRSRLAPGAARSRDSAAIGKTDSGSQARVVLFMRAPFSTLQPKGAILSLCPRKRKGQLGPFRRRHRAAIVHLGFIRAPVHCAQVTGAASP